MSKLRDKPDVEPTVHRLGGRKNKTFVGETTRGAATVTAAKDETPKGGAAGIKETIQQIRRSINLAQNELAQ